MRVVFFGTAAFGLPTLRALADAHEVALVVTAPDAPAGRGRKLSPPPVKTEALSLGLPVLQPPDLRDPEFIEALKQIGADLFFVVAFRILPRAVFALPPMGTVNLHGSLLPDLRGAAPINRAIMSGDEVTGVTTFLIDETVDTGAILLKRETAIGPDETAGELAARMSVMGAGLSVETVDRLERGDIAAVPQPEGKTRPAPKLYREDRVLDFDVPAREVHNRVRGLSPVPAAYVPCGGGPVKVLRSAVVDETFTGLAPGTVVSCGPDGGLEVACAPGRIRLLELKPPGKGAMTDECFLRGYRVDPGTGICELY